MVYENYCSTCGKEWESGMDDEVCPVCGEDDLAKIVTESIEE